MDHLFSVYSSNYFYRGPSTLAGLAIICIMIPVTKTVAKVCAPAVFPTSVAFTPLATVQQIANFVTSPKILLGDD
jgi:hypothetical protein